MISFSRSSSCTPVPTSHDKFLSMLPMIRRQARLAFRRLRPEQREELIEEVCANSFVAYARLVARGKVDAAFATPLATFAIRQVRAGRRVGTKLNVRDISSLYCQRSKGTRMDRLDKFDPVAEDRAQELTSTARQWFTAFRVRGRHIDVYCPKRTSAGISNLVRLAAFDQDNGSGT